MGWADTKKDKWDGSLNPLFLNGVGGILLFCYTFLAAVRGIGVEKDRKD